MSNLQVHFLSQTNEWATPQDFFDELNSEFNFTLDPCATDDNHKCDKYYTKEDNGLLQSWDNERVFCNPPYGREIKHWVKKASEAVGGGSSDADTSSYRHNLLSRLYLQQSRDTFYSRTIEVWKLKKLSPVPKYGSCF